MRATGYLGAALEFSTLFRLAKDEGYKKNESASNLYYGAAFSIGSGLGLTTFVLTSSTVPVVGWVMATGILASMTGVYLHGKAKEASRNPLMKQWLENSVFGNEPLQQELEILLKTFFRARFTPQELNKNWNDEWFAGDILRLPRWGDKMSFEILLPGYIEGISLWSYRLDVYEDDGVGTAEEAAKAKVLLEDTSIVVYETYKPEGLLLEVRKNLEILHANSARLSIIYTPNPALSGEQTTLTDTFYLDD